MSEIEVQQQHMAAPAAGRSAAAGIASAVRSEKLAATAGSGSNMDGPSREQPQQRKGRSKNKRGKGGGGMCATDGSSPAAATGLAEGPPNQKKKRRQQKKQARKQRQRAGHHNDAENEQQPPPRGPERQRDQARTAATEAVAREILLPVRQNSAEAAEGKGAEIGNGVAKTVDFAKDVAPFECSWTTAPGSRENGRDLTRLQGESLIT